MVNYWLMKAEPDTRIVMGKDVKFSVDDFEKINITPWEGVRNHVAKLKMKYMKIGDKVLFYHSNCKVPGVAAIAEVHREAYPDHSAWDPTHPYFDKKTKEETPTWYMVDLKFTRRLPHLVPLVLLKHIATCSHSDLSQIRASSPSPDSSSSAEGLSYLTEEDLTSIKTMQVLYRSRLSVQDVTEPAFNAVIKLGDTGGWEGFRFPKPPKGQNAGKRKKGKEPEEDGGDDDEDKEMVESQASSSRKKRKGRQEKPSMEPERSVGEEEGSSKAVDNPKKESAPSKRLTRSSSRRM
ncbi:hypothetical protein FRC02_006818 [Tulasnella sp. 418]|nr:hypothetical protein FRC02_006818 [Tulasnella sp. 418]